MTYNFLTILTSSKNKKTHSRIATRAGFHAHAHAHAEHEANFCPELG